ncbi:MAG: hypothetical protein KJO95_10645 [Gammaproteobacteria bacterium]|nr:hypothetical protein [Gammaproteobacteria bacterium]MBU2676250.1 hypothetical protein [Gammaproteobacteria bacterium]NNC56642.1 hypothetical protein [Woeseiaceae bacterium]NNL49985.1 hypothetical protein [Woeseiaceae bacterium]
MKKITISSIVISLMLLLGSNAHAQAIEAVYGIKYDDSGAAKAAIDEIFQDDAVSGTKVSLYVHDFGVPGNATHTVVADYDSYAARDKLDTALIGSHGWARYELATQGSKSMSSELAIVVKDYGNARHEAGYLVAFSMQVRDPAAYVTALGKLNDAIGNPGVLRLVAIRSGLANVTHAVLVGGADFAATNAYLDKLFASDAYAAFNAEVANNRTMLNVGMYRRVGHWGY